MKYRLPRCFLAVDNDPIAIVGQPLGRSNRFCSTKQTGDEFIVFVADITDGRDMLARNDQYVRRRLRIVITKSDRSVRFVNDLRRNFASLDLAEQTVWSRPSPLLFNYPSAVKGMRKCTAINILKFTTKRNAMSNAAGLNLVSSSQLRQEMRCRVSLNGRVRRND